MPRSRTVPPSRWIRVILGAAALLVGAVLPSPFGRRPEFRFFGPDKLLHLLGHGGFAAAVVDALGSRRLGPWQAGALAVCLSAGYAFLLGRLQERVPGRESEAADLVASLLGSILGVTWWRSRRGGDGKGACGVRNAE